MSQTPWCGARGMRDVGRAGMPRHGQRSHAYRKMQNPGKNKGYRFLRRYKSGIPTKKGSNTFETVTNAVMPSIITALFFAVFFFVLALFFFAQLFYVGSVKAVFPVAELAVHLHYLFCGKNIEKLVW